MKRSPMCVHTRSDVKNVISKSPLEAAKHITYHSVRKTQTNRLKQNDVAKSEIISIAGHSTEIGFRSLLQWRLEIPEGCIQ